MAKKSVLISLTIIVIIGSMILGVVVQAHQSCEALKTPPVIDIFPEAQVSGISSSRIHEDYSIVVSALGAYNVGEVTTEYTSNSDFEDVKAYYSLKGICDGGKDGSRCVGETQPYGIYSLFIYPPSYPAYKTTLSFQVNWHMCADKM